MAFDFTSFASSADAPISFGKRELVAGEYTFRVDDILNGRSQAGAEKYEAKLTVVAQANGGTDMIGVSRKQHFVVGHSKESVAKTYQAQLAHFLKVHGIDLNKINSEGDLLMACKAVVAKNPTSVWNVKPQDKDPHYLDWTFVSSGSTQAQAQAQAPAASTQVEDDLFA